MKEVIVISLYYTLCVQPWTPSHEQAFMISY